MHEFNRALEHRKQHGWPIIMFYFCDEAIPIPTNSAILKQLQNVVAFRKRLAELGCTAEAQAEAKLLVATQPHWRISEWLANEPYKNPADAKIWLDAYRLAGLPE